MQESANNRKFFATTTTVDYLSIVDRIGEILQTASIAASLPLETRSGSERSMDIRENWISAKRRRFKTTRLVIGNW